MSFKIQYSYWEHQSFLKDIDVAIIGSGIVGLNAAIKLKELQPDWKVVIMERGALPSGASTKNAGFACFGSVSEILEDIQNMGEEACFKLIKSRWEGLKRLRKRTGDINIDYQNLGGYEVFRPEAIQIFEKCKAAIPYLNDKIYKVLGLKDAYCIADERLGRCGMEGFDHMIWNQWEGQLDPGKMIRALMKIAIDLGVEFINGMQVNKIEDTELTGVNVYINDTDLIKVRKVIVATNGFAKQLLPELDVRPARNQVIVTEPINNLAINGCFHFDHGYYYWRNINGRILLGGGRHLFLDREFTDELSTTNEVIDMLKQFLYEKILSEERPKIEYSWAGILGLGPVKAPIIKQISKNVTVSVRMGGMGIALGTLAGEQAVEELLKNS